MKAISIALLAGIVVSVLGVHAPAAQATKWREKVLHSFCTQPNCTDGQAPDASLIDVNGTLYGTTVYGGSVPHCANYYDIGCGTVYALDRSTGVETALYSFCSRQNCTDGYEPLGSLIYVNGILYGTTGYGGAGNCRTQDGSGCGVVFALDPNTGTETVLHVFGSGADGQNPSAGLINVKGTLYGTTLYGGAYGDGTVFAVNRKTGVENVVYSFCSGRGYPCADGTNPVTSLIYMNGTLYGTTAGGGTGCQEYGCGTVFALDPNTGVETVLHSFSGRTDGDGPEANLVEANGVLYGTTWGGGDYGLGTVFALDLSTTTESVLHSFGGGMDGSSPEAGLIDVNGVLYGTTPFGGINGLGTVFALDPATGIESVLHSFSNGTGGYFPWSSLIDVKGALYGTNGQGGGAANCPGGNICGTVFALKKKH